MKTVLVTGGSRGIGKKAAEKFESEGYIVYTPGRNEMDLSDDESVECYIKSHSQQGFDVIVNNAGINEINKITDVTDNEIQQMININLVAPIKIIRGFTETMKKNKYGRIVNIGSIWAIVSKPGRSIYSVTKNGIHGLTNALAVELAPHNILVNTVCPGFTLTELTRKNNSNEEIINISQDIPIRRMAEPEEIAELIFFLCSEKNTYITGQKIAIDGGFTAK